MTPQRRSKNWARQTWTWVAKPVLIVSVFLPLAALGGIHFLLSINRGLARDITGILDANGRIHLNKLLGGDLVCIFPRSVSGVRLLRKNPLFANAASNLILPDIDDESYWTIVVGNLRNTNLKVFKAKGEFVSPANLGHGEALLCACSLSAVKEEHDDRRMLEVKNSDMSWNSPAQIATADFLRACSSEATPEEILHE